MNWDSIDAFETRTWAKCRADKFRDQLNKKLLIVQESLLPKEFHKDLTGFLIQTLLNTVSFQHILSCLFAEILTAKNKEIEERSIDRLSWYLSAVNALFYCLRIGRSKPKVLALVCPWKIPCGCMHLIDFDRDNLRLLLSEAKQTHGVNTYRKIVKKLFSEEFPEPESVNPEPLSPEMEKMWDTTKSILKNTCKLAKIPAKEITAIEKLLNSKDLEVMERFKHGQEEIIKTMPDYVQYESEFRKSFGHVSSESALEFFMQSELYRAKGMRNKTFIALYKKEWTQYGAIPTDRAKASSDEVLSAYKANLKQVQKVSEWKSSNNSCEAYRRYKIKCGNKEAIPETRFINILDLVHTDLSCSDISRTITAQDFGIGESSCASHIKKASFNKNINVRWLEKIILPLIKQ